MKKLLALVLTLALALALLAGCGQTKPTSDPAATQEGQDKELEKIIFTEPVRGYHWAPAYLAQTLGYFEEEGLEAEFQSVTGGDPAAPMFAGEAQFTLAGIEMALMTNEMGQGCKILVSPTQKYPYQLIGAGEKYSTMESLKGGVIAGGQGVTSAPQAFARTCIQAVGMKPDEDVSVVSMKSAAYAAAIQAGEIQAAVSTNPWSAKQLVDNGGVVIVDGTDEQEIKEMIGSSTYELFAIITTDKFIQSNPETVQKAVNAMAKAMKWMETATPQQIVEKLLPLFEGAEEELLYDATYDQEHKIASFTGYHTEEGFKAGVEMTKRSGGIKTDMTADQVYDESFLDKAWETIGK